MKRFCCILVLSVLFISSWAIPARRGIYKTIRLEDGTEVRAELRGDEYVSWWQTDDGQQHELMTNERLLARKDIPRPRRSIGESHASNPLVGSMRGLLVLVQFHDVWFQDDHTRPLYDKILNGLGYSNPNLGFVGSVRDYFLDQSNGQFDYQFDVVGPVTLKNTQSYYGKNSAYGDRNVNMKDFVVESLNEIKDQVDFSRYDNDHDGYVDEVFFLFAGKAESDGGGTDCIWPHMYYLQSGYGVTFQQNGVTVDTYACAHEIQMGDRINGIGAIVHEFSHCLGLPDMYDTTGGGCYGEDDWSVMHSGCYLGSSYRPCGYTAYEREFCGWKQIVPLDTETQIDHAASISDGGTAFKMVNAGHPQEYFILEPRSQTGWDKDLPAEGLLVHHVDYDEYSWWANTINTRESHQRCAIVPSDNNFLPTSVGSDIFPSNYGDELSDLTSPSTTLFNRNIDNTKSLGQSVYNIRANDDHTVSFCYTPSVYEYQAPVMEGSVFYESFNHCYGQGGNDGQFDAPNAGKGVLRADNTWTCTSSMSAGLGCAMFGKSLDKTYATSPVIAIDGPMVLRFRTCPYKTDNKKLVLQVKDAEGNILQQESFDVQAGRWNDIETEINHSGAIQLVFAAYQRFFLDEVVVLSQEMGISNIDVSASDRESLFNIAGQQVSAGHKGIVISKGKKYFVR